MCFIRYEAEVAFFIINIKYDMVQNIQPLYPTQVYLL